MVTATPDPNSDHRHMRNSDKHPPGAKLVYQTTKKRASGPKCPVTGKRIQGKNKKPLYEALEKVKAELSLATKGDDNCADKINQNSGDQLEVRGNSAENANVILHSNGKSSDNISSFTQNNHVDSVSVASSHHGMHGYLQAGHMSPLHSYVMHQQEIPQLVQPREPSPYVEQSVLQQQKAIQGVQGLISSDVKSEYQVPATGQSDQGYLDVQNGQGEQYGSTTHSSSVNEPVGGYASYYMW